MIKKTLYFLPLTSIKALVLTFHFQCLYASCWRNVLGQHLSLQCHFKNKVNSFRLHAFILPPAPRWRTDSTAAFLRYYSSDLIKTNKFLLPTTRWQLAPIRFRAYPGHAWEHTPRLLAKIIRVTLV